MRQGETILYNNIPIEFLIDKSIFTAYISAKAAYHALREKKESEYYSRMKAFGVDRDQIEDYTPEQDAAALEVDNALDAELGSLRPALESYVAAQTRAYKEAVRFTHSEARTCEQRELAEFMATVRAPNLQAKFIALTCKNLGIPL